MDQIKELDTVRNSPPEISNQIIEAKVPELLEIQNDENYWQRELDKTQYQLVFKNLRKNPATINQHPWTTFQEGILNPLNLSHEDQQKLTPIAVININKEKPTQNHHLLICTFSSIEAISLLKQNAKHLPRAIKFNPRVPHQYLATMTDELKQQTQLRMMRNKDGNPLVKSRITTNKGHLILEVADRVDESWGPYYTRSSFIPTSGTNIPTTDIRTPPHKYVLLQHRWENPVTSEIQNRYKALLQRLDLENFSFNGSKHTLNITIKANLETLTVSEMSKDPLTTMATKSSIAH